MITEAFVRQNWLWYDTLSLSPAHLADEINALLEAARKDEHTKIKSILKENYYKAYLLDVLIDYIEAL